MRDDDVNGEGLGVGCPRIGLSGLGLVAVLLVAAGCGKKGTDCDKAVANFMEWRRASKSAAIRSR